MLTGGALSPCGRARAAGVDLVDRTESCWKRCSGYCVRAHPGGISRPSTARGRRCTPGCRGGLREARVVVDAGVVVVGAVDMSATLVDDALTVGTVGGTQSRLSCADAG